MSQHLEESSVIINFTSGDRRKSFIKKFCPQFLGITLCKRIVKVGMQSCFQERFILDQDAKPFLAQQSQFFVHTQLKSSRG